MQVASDFEVMHDKRISLAITGLTGDFMITFVGKKEVIWELQHEGLENPLRGRSAIGSYFAITENLYMYLVLDSKSPITYTINTDTGTLKGVSIIDGKVVQWTGTFQFVDSEG